ncbi:MAG: agmatinase family protein [Bacteroidia bacterium]
MSKDLKIKNFDPNGIGQLNDGLFGLPFSMEECETVLIPVPWEVTVSYRSGTADGPAAIAEASYQVDLYDPVVKDAWKLGIWMDEENPLIREKSELLRPRVENYLEMLANGENPENNRTMQTISRQVQEGCFWMNVEVKRQVKFFLDKNKIVGLVGGDHSTPLGMMDALAEKFGSYGILQIDAHADLRNAYEGFEFSHASIMYNALKMAKVEKLVQVGIRDFCQEEFDLINNSKGRVKTFFDRDIKHAMYGGEVWDKICDQIVSELPQKVYLSFDIDGLDPKLCPNTGTPVAGGFEVEQILYLIEKVVKSGKQIIAFDLNEVTPGKAEGDDWDANVAARLLYRLCNLVAMSNGKAAG